MKRMLIGLLCAVSLACGPGAEEEAPGEEVLGQEQDALSTPTTLAWSSPVDLIASTGNLYWTSYAIDEFGPDSASVWRASKSNTPGSEVLLYRESGDTADFRYFGSLCYANIGGNWFGYFVANYGATSQLKRVPLTGGAAITLATSPGFIGTRDLVTDGATLFWADSAGLRSMPIGGGAVTTMTSGTALSKVVLGATQLFYSDGATLRGVAKAGGVTFGVATDSSAVSALAINASGVLYWGTLGGAVRSVRPGSGSSTLQNPIAGRQTTSVDYDGNRAVWTDCTYPNTNSCAVRTRQFLFNVTLASGGVGTGKLQSDASHLYFGEAGGLKKL